MKVIFMGTPDFAATALGALLAAGHDLVCVYTQPPRAAGRGKQPRPSPVQLLAESHGIAVRCPAQLKSAAAQQEFAALGADVAVVAAYGLILPQAVLDAPRYGCLNIHASLLPRWRGAAPIQRAVQAGDTESGITIMQMDAGLDTGPTVASRAVPMPSTMTAGELHDVLAPLGGEMIVAALADLSAGRLSSQPQPDAGVTYASKLDKAEAALDWRLPAADLVRQIRAFNPVPGAFFAVAGQRIKVFQAQATKKRMVDDAAPGCVLDDQLTIACGQGTCLMPQVVQRPGKGPMAVADMLRGFPLPAGTRLDPAA